MTKTKTKLKLIAVVALVIFWAGSVTYYYNQVLAAKPKAYTYSGISDLYLLARIIRAEAEGEPYAGKVAIAAVILNRVRHPGFPNTIAGVIFQPGAFESVANGRFWSLLPNRESIKAAYDALRGWDPTYGALFFWNPAKKVSRWIWTRKIIARIGKHVFGR
ncbi:cell wall hydrolase [Carboxydothermus hydrogenoformans]|uniref:Putative spore cortex-lytic enzyme n=1 Tax=Carboxydothermus hydrogenoformans (strain ATCC BAA-161 / DSM 6008 / Z-2901) TaxID=246194 RepID=Q3ACX9_CARHZ|nr:cell wall hydrolase [Carboxydothermus hydrogenoformans]ABB15919.1 putative spore cortex-lytic enzyme [Carboxydothermus hydrogenoformans Z-2901]